MTHRVPFIVRKGELKCATCGKTQALERQADPKAQTIPPGAPWLYPKGWLVGADGWFCSLEHVLPKHPLLRLRPVKVLR